MGETVYDTSGNNDGGLDPGETADMTATFMNIGGADLTNATTTLSCTSPYVTINDAVGYFGTIEMDSIKENVSDPYNVTVDGETPHGELADFTIYASGSGGYADTFDFTLILGDPVPTDTGYYYVYYTGGAHAQAPVFNWIAIDSTQTTYPGTSLDLADNQTAQISLPFTFKYYGVDYTQISICSNGWIAMGSQNDVDWTNSMIPNYDGPQAMIAALWDDLDPGNAGSPSDIYYYYDDVTHRFIIEYFQVEHYVTGSHETFEIILCDENYYPTPTNDGEIYVQYLVEQQQLDNTLGIENYTENIGIQYFFNDTYNPLGVPITDEFALRYTTIPPEMTNVSEQDIEAASTTLSVFPTVINGHATISYSLPVGSQAICVTIHDAMGRLVRQFDVYANTATLVWDGTDHAGVHVPNGVYFVRASAGTQQAAQKVIVIE